MLDVCVIGHVVRDINTIGGAEYEPQPGGAAYYSTMVYRSLGLRTAVVTRVAAADELRLLAELRRAGVTIFNRPTRRTTTFRNFYAPDNPDLRVQRVDAFAAPITVDDLPDLHARIWQIGPLTENDIDPAIISHCAQLGGTVGMDVQGLTRQVVDGEVRPRGPAREMGYLCDLDVLKADEDEILIFTGERTIAAAVAKVQRAGVREVLVTRGSRGSTVFGPRQRFEIAAVPPHHMADATGCGDTYLAAYLARRLVTDDLAECGAFAAAAATLKIENLGAFRSSLAEVADRLALFASALEEGAAGMGPLRLGAETGSDGTGS